MLHRLIFSLFCALALTPGVAMAQDVLPDGSQLTQVANLAAVALQDLSDDYGLIDYDTQRSQNTPRTDHMIAYERFDDAPPIGPHFVEMRLVIFSGAQPRSLIDAALTEYLTIGAPDLIAITPPLGLERFRWFSVEDPFQAMTGWAALLETPNGFASIAALGEADEFTLDDLVTITNAAAARLGA